MINASTKLLEVCHNPIQQLEVSKTIILSKSRLNSLKLTNEQPGHNTDQHLGNVYITDLRIPLSWNIDDLINPKKDVTNHYAMFAVISCNGSVFDTELVSNIYSELSEVSFSETIVFSNVTPDFRMDLSLYSCQTMQKSREKTFDRIKSLLRTHHTSKSILQPPEFKCIARAKLGLRDINPQQSSSSHVWCMQGDNLYPPLYDYFSFRLWAKPDYQSAAPCIGHKVTVSWSDSEIVVSNCHVKFSDMTVQLWMSEFRFSKGCEPWKEITLTEDSNIYTTDNTITWNECDINLVTLSFKTDLECERFGKAMGKQLESFKAWNHFERLPDRNGILSPTNNSPLKYRRQKRSQSKLILMYNQVSGVNLMNGYRAKHTVI